MHGAHSDTFHLEMSSRSPHLALQNNYTRPTIQLENYFMQQK